MEHIDKTISKILLSLSILFLVSCRANAREKINEQINEGKIFYHTELTPNPDWGEKDESLLSQDFIQRSTMANIGKTTVLTFKGNQTLTEGYDSEFGFFSPYFQIFKGEEGDVIYGKEFLELKWYIKYPLAERVQENEIVTVTFLPEEEIISGYRCKKAKIQGGARSTYVFYTEEIKAFIPKSLWMKNDLIPGVILKEVELPGKYIGSLMSLHQVDSIQLTSINDTVFLPPNNFEYFNDSNEARDKNHLLVEIAAKKELEDKPLSKIEQQMYFGNWILEKEEIQIKIQIQPNEDSIRFIVTNWSNSNLFSRYEISAKLLGRKLLVEDRNHSELYELNLTKDKLISLGNPFMELIKVYDIDENN